MVTGCSKVRSDEKKNVWLNIGREAPESATRKAGDLSRKDSVVNSQDDSKVIDFRRVYALFQRHSYPYIQSAGSDWWSIAIFAPARTDLSFAQRWYAALPFLFCS